MWETVLFTFNQFYLTEKHIILTLYVLWYGYFLKLPAGITGAWLLQTEEKVFLQVKSAGK